MHIKLFGWGFHGQDDSEEKGKTSTQKLWVKKGTSLWVEKKPVVRKS